MNTIKDLMIRLARRVRPHEVNISEYASLLRSGVLLATARKDGQEIFLCLVDPASFNLTLEQWKGNFYQDLELWFVPNERRAELACEFIRRFARQEDVLKNPLRFKGLDWYGENYWVAIASEGRNSDQGDLFEQRAELIPLNVGDDLLFKTLRRALYMGKLKSLFFYKMKKIQGEQFRYIYPWWLQKKLVQKLRQGAKTFLPERLESAG